LPRGPDPELGLAANCGLGCRLGRHRGRGRARPFQVEGANIGLPHEPVRALPELLQEAALYQGIDLVRAGLERLGRFFERAEHPIHRGRSP
jgi:hypothetical protein